MANLVPPIAKKRITFEYWTRVISVWLGLGGMVAFILAALNAPVYLLIVNQLDAFSSRYADASNQQASFAATETKIVTANNTATLLATMNTVSPLVPFVTELQSLTGSAVTISSYRLNRTGVAIKAVDISGTAADRASLVEFSERVKASELFVEAEIPLSNLAKDRDIPFQISVIIDGSS